jgi:cell division protein FtsQ
MMAKKSASNSQMSKAEAKRKEQQRLAILLWLKLMTVAVFVGGGIYWGVSTLMDPNLLPLKVVRADGKFRYMQRQDLEQAVGKVTRGGFLTVDVEAIRDKAKSLPWVDKVSVRRVWPDSLQLWVEEHVPLSRWGKSAVLNVRGEVIYPKRESIPAGLPNLSGPDGSGQELAHNYNKIKAKATSLGLVITELYMDERRAWTIRFQNKLVVRLGNKDVEERLARFYSIYPLLKEDKRELQTVDMRYTNGVAITWKETEPTVGHVHKTKILRGLV